MVFSLRGDLERVQAVGWHFGAVPTLQVAYLLPVVATALVLYQIA
jgi:hypothetical protein